MFNRDEIRIIASAIMGGSNEVCLSGNRGAWFAGPEIQVGTIRAFEREAHAATIAKCRGDAVNALARLNQACQSRRPGDPCAIV